MITFQWIWQILKVTGKFKKERDDLFISFKGVSWAFLLMYLSLLNELAEHSSCCLLKLCSCWKQNALLEREILLPLYGNFQVPFDWIRLLSSYIKCRNVIFSIYVLWCVCVERFACVCVCVCGVCVCVCVRREREREWVRERENGCVNPHSRTRLYNDKLIMTCK